ncbi:MULTISPECIES: hypothetical protein [unclassified Streptomyces]|uniref:hypothetical protein n=1 Tax=unclassified Streptomyces TaxID=2593676 RepID=UPI00037BCB9A|nr:MULTISPECIES: hypothetical protein [unclassified Streptomyces]MYY03112.1 hypothetical protein [Streptomyces sp. SID4913]
MEFKIEDLDGGMGPFESATIATGAESYGPEGLIMVEGVDRMFPTPAQARELAAALLRAADEAEDVEPVDIEQAVRNKVAEELEQMDGKNLGMNVSRTQAVNVARRGLRPEDTRHGTTQKMWLY